jgi:response regulator RpfG family c-di-GMP phosphodiesterase
MKFPIVLCIDERPDRLQLCKKVLESNGFCIETASNGRESLQVLEQTPVDAVLLEYKRERKDTESLACRINRQFPNVPIILLSAYFDMPEQILWLVDEFVMKSELPENLASVVDRVTGRTKIDQTLTFAVTTRDRNPQFPAA